MKSKPASLHKQEKPQNPFEILNKGFVLKIKFYVAVAMAMVLFLIFCFLVQHQTYGFINW